MVDNTNLKIIILVSFFVGLVAGMYSYDYVNDDQAQTKVETVTEIKYVPVEIPVKTVEYVTVEVPVPTYIKDTIYLDKNFPVNNYKGASRTEFGNLYYDISTAGYLLDYKFKPDFLVTTQVPQVTNTVTKTTTITKKPAGLFITAGSYQNNFYVGGVFVKDKYLVGLNTSGFQIGYKLK